MDTDQLFYRLFFLNFSTFTTYGVAFSFFPNISKFHGLSATETGTIFVFYPLGGLCVGYFIARMLPYFSKKGLLNFFMLTLSFSLISFGAGNYFQNKAAFVLISAISRFIQGFSAGGYETILLSFVPLLWPQEMERKYAILEISAGLGIGLGPVIGSAIYYCFGYFNIFIIQSIYICLFGLFVNYKYIPSSFSEVYKDKEKEDVTNYRELLINKKLLFCCLIICFNFTAFTLTTTDLENQVIKFGGSPLICSIILLILNIGSIITIFGIGKAKERFGKVLLFIFAITFNIIALLFYGGEIFVSFEDENLIFLFYSCGSFIMGMGNAITIVLFIPYCLEILNSLTHLNSEERNGDISCCLYTSFLSIAEIIGPIIGGCFADTVGFSMGCLLFDVILLAFLIIFVDYGGGYASVKEFQSRLRKKNNSLTNPLIELNSFKTLV